jgi:hypothetical protein
MMFFLPPEWPAGDGQAEGHRGRPAAGQPESRGHADVLQQQRRAGDAGRSGGGRRSAHRGLYPDGARGGRTSTRQGDGDHDALADDGPADAGWKLAWQRSQSPTPGMQHHQSHRDGCRRSGVLPAPGPKKSGDGNPAKSPAVAACCTASVGWSQFTRTEPDAYATGISLFAQHVAGVPAADKAYRNGVAFLRGTQYQDGAGW